MTSKWNRLGTSGLQFLVTTAVVTRKLGRLGPSGLAFLVTTAVVNRKWNPLGPSLQQFLVTAAAWTSNFSSSAAADSARPWGAQAGFVERGSRGGGGQRGRGRRKQRGEVGERAEGGQHCIPFDWGTGATRLDPLLFGG